MIGIVYVATIPICYGGEKGNGSRSPEQLPQMRAHSHSNNKQYGGLKCLFVRKENTLFHK